MSKFKIGDRVRLTDQWTGSPKNGSVGTVQCIDVHEPDFLKVFWHSNKCVSPFVSEKRFVLVSTQAQDLNQEENASSKFESERERMARFFSSSCRDWKG